MTGISQMLRGASEIQDNDTAQVFANVLNTDLHAMKVFNGSMIYQAKDALRVARILAEYERMNGQAMKRGVAQTVPVQEKA